MGNVAIKLSQFAKLTPKQIRQIRKLLLSASKTQSELAEMFHVSQATISNIITNKVYRRV